MRIVYVILALIIPVCQATFESCYSDEELRECNDDYQTPGRCYEFFNTPKNWFQGDEDCHNVAEASHIQSSLAIIESQKQQDFINERLSERGWDATWVNVLREKRVWHWILHWDRLAYQGCWQDNPSDPDMTTLKNLPPNSQVADCLEACDGNDWTSVQLDSDGEMVCRCSNHKGRKYSQIWDADCDNPCPHSSDGIINKVCGGVNKQIVFFTLGTRYYFWAPIVNRSPGECVSMDHSHGHRWVERDCKDKLAFICQYGLWDRSACERSSSKHVWIEASSICVSIHNEPLDFYQTVVYCHNAPYRKSRLFRPYTTEQHYDLVRELDPERSYWFGLGHEEWLISNRHRVYNYFNWANNQPVVTKGKDCGVMRKSSGYKWFSEDCNGENLPYICTIDICPGDGVRVPVVKTTTPDDNTKGDETTTEKGAETTTEKGAETTTGGLPKILFYGLGAGAGGVIIIVLVIIGICFCCRYYWKKADNPIYIGDESHPSRQSGPQFVDNPAYGAKKGERYKESPGNLPVIGKNKRNPPSPSEHSYYSLYPPPYNGSDSGSTRYVKPNKERYNQSSENRSANGNNKRNPQSPRSGGSVKSEHSYSSLYPPSYNGSDSGSTRYVKPIKVKPGTKY